MFPILSKVQTLFPVSWLRASDRYLILSHILLHCYHAPVEHFPIHLRKELINAQHVPQVYSNFHSMPFLSRELAFKEFFYKTGLTARGLSKGISFPGVISEYVRAITKHFQLDKLPVSALYA